MTTARVLSLFLCLIILSAVTVFSIDPIDSDNINEDTLKTEQVAENNDQENKELAKNDLEELPVEDEENVQDQEDQGVEETRDEEIQEEEIREEVQEEEQTQEEIQEEKIQEEEQIQEEAVQEQEQIQEEVEIQDEDVQKEEGNQEEEIQVDNLQDDLEEEKAEEKEVIVPEENTEEIDPHLPVELDEEGFYDFINAHPNEVLIVQLYAPWCGYCKRLAPIWDDLAKELHSREVSFDGLKYNVLSINADEHKGIASALRIGGYPTILVLREGKVHRFKGKRTVESIIDFAQNRYTSSEYFRIDKYGEYTLQERFDDLVHAITVASMDLTKAYSAYQGSVIVLSLFSFSLGILMALLLCFIRPSEEPVSVHKKND